LTVDEVDVGEVAADKLKSSARNPVSLLVVPPVKSIWSVAVFLTVRFTHPAQVHVFLLPADAGVLDK
jgi:hypothetical protein